MLFCFGCREIMWVEVFEVQGLKFERFPLADYQLPNYWLMMTAGTWRTDCWLLERLDCRFGGLWFVVLDCQIANYWLRIADCPELVGLGKGKNCTAWCSTIAEAVAVAVWGSRFEVPGFPATYRLPPCLPPMPVTGWLNCWYWLSMIACSLRDLFRRESQPCFGGLKVAD